MLEIKLIHVSKRGHWWIGKWLHIHNKPQWNINHVYIYMHWYGLFKCQSYVCKRACIHHHGVFGTMAPNGAVLSIKTLLITKCKRCISQNYCWYWQSQTFMLIIIGNGRWDLAHERLSLISMLSYCLHLIALPLPEDDDEPRYPGNDMSMYITTRNVYGIVGDCYTAV